MFAFSIFSPLLTRQRKNIISCFLTSYTHLDPVSVVTAYVVYFCAFARSEIFQKNARKSGVGRGQFDAGVNGLSGF